MGENCLSEAGATISSRESRAGRAERIVYNFSNVDSNLQISSDLLLYLLKTLETVNSEQDAPVHYLQFLTDSSFLQIQTSVSYTPISS